MPIFIMRHGEAQPFVRSDKERKLTELGVQQAEASGAWLKQKYFPDSNLDYALVSPFYRTRQTFTAFNDQLIVKQCEYSEDVVPTGPVSVVADYLGFLVSEGHESVLLVSHMPLVSYLVDEMCHQSHSLLFSTGSVAVIDWDKKAGTGSLLEYYQPQVSLD